MSPEVIAVIPAWNEQERVGPVVAGILRHVDRVVVVDDGSSDGTAEAAVAAGATVVAHPERRGKGCALRTGLAVAAEQNPRFVLFLDADGQHDPADAPNLLRAAKENGFDLVIGSRGLSPVQGGAVRYYTNVVSCNMLSRWTGHEVTDTQSGYRLVRLSRLAGVQLNARGFEIETEMLLKLARAGARIGHVLVRSGPATRKSRLRPVRDVTRICFSVLKYHFTAG